MRTERLIHAVIFFLLFAGLAVLGAYGCNVFLHGNIVLLAASITLVLGIILLAMYVVFKELGWTWWT